MTVAELREELERFDDETEVMFAYDYGDHPHTIVADSIAEVDNGTVVWSSYHRTYKVAEDEDEVERERGYEPRRPPKDVVIIR